MQKIIFLQKSWILNTTNFIGPLMLFCFGIALGILTLILEFIVYFFCIPCCRKVKDKSVFLPISQVRSPNLGNSVLKKARFKLSLFLNLWGVLLLCRLLYVGPRIFKIKVVWSNGIENCLKLKLGPENDLQGANVMSSSELSLVFFRFDFRSTTFRIYAFVCFAIKKEESDGIFFGGQKHTICGFSLL